MADTITINGVSLAATDYCGLYQALYAAKLKIIAGESVTEMTIRSPVTQETIVMTPANIKAIDAELIRLKQLCDAGSASPRIFNVQAKRGYFP